MLSIDTESLPSAPLNFPYSETLLPGGRNALTWSVTVGSLPTGLSLNTATGEITGTPTELGIFDFTVQVVSADEWDRQP